MIFLSETHDVVVCGGGLAGVCAAIAAARHGARVALVQERPVLGGNASSEIRVTVHGAAQIHAYARETGILSEILIEERSRNHEEINENGWTNSVFDQVLYDLVKRTPGLTLHLNTAVVDVLAGDDDLSCRADLEHRPAPDPVNGWYHRPGCAPRDRIAAVVCRVAQAETELTLRATTFIDGTGDGFVADLAGCGWRMGSESREQTGELHAPEVASTDTMGSSIHIRARNIGRPAPFTPPEWIRKIPADFFENRRRNYSDLRGGYWWIEIGVPWHTIHDNEIIRDELTAWALAIWDWIKNHDPATREAAANFALEWIGQVPGKRETRRIDGIHRLSECEIQDNVLHPDEIGFGGWYIDLHTPGGLLAKHSEPLVAGSEGPNSENATKSCVGPYGIPLGSHIAADVKNLFLVGRCVSATHAALGTVRVMGTTAVTGQAVGTAAAMAMEKSQSLADLREPGLLRELQQRLLRDGVFLVNHKNNDPLDLARSASVSASSQALNHGAEINAQWISGGLSRGPSSQAFPLVKPVAQWIAVAGGNLESLSVCLENTGSSEQGVRARLVRVESIWDYRREIPELAATEWMVPPGRDRWIEWPVGLSGLPDGFVRLELTADSGDIRWQRSNGIAPGQVASGAMSQTRFRRLESGVTMAFRLKPPQPAFAPEQVLSGVTRPHAATNLWRSNPECPLPQWLEFSWPKPVTISRVELTFPGHLLREVHACPPFFRDPQTAKDYTIEGWIHGQWNVLHLEKNNYQRHRTHLLKAAVTVQRLRLVVSATNGDPSVGLYEFRAYA